MNEGFKFGETDIKGCLTSNNNGQKWSFNMIHCLFGELIYFLFVFVSNMKTLDRTSVDNEVDCEGYHNVKNESI